MESLKYIAQWVKPNPMTGLPFQFGDMNENGDLFFDYNFQEKGQAKWIRKIDAIAASSAKLFDIKKNRFLKFGDKTENGLSVIGALKQKREKVTYIVPVFGEVNLITGLPYLPGDVSSEGKIFRMYAAKSRKEKIICRQLWIEPSDLSLDRFGGKVLCFGEAGIDGLVFNRFIVPQQNLNAETKTQKLKNGKLPRRIYHLGWSELQVNELIHRWFLGQSANQIGRAIGKSRNAILSKANRLSLPRGEEFRKKLAKAFKLNPLEDLSPDTDVSSIPILNDHSITPKSINNRIGQQGFRQDILILFGRRCAITGTEAQEVLEAAHIIPYSKSQNNDSTNGLCLRADIHSLYDLGIISITEDLVVYVSSRMTDPEYTKFDKKVLELPIRAKTRINRSFLKWHFENIFDHK